MENTTRKRTRKAGAPETIALKKSVSAALKAAWHVEQLRARIEKPKRKRNTLAKKLEEQREALLKIKATVDAFLAAIAPACNGEQVLSPKAEELANAFLGAITPEAAPVITPETQPVLEDPSAVVLDPSAAA